MTTLPQQTRTRLLDGLAEVLSDMEAGKDEVTLQDVTSAVAALARVLYELVSR